MHWKSGVEKEKEERERGKGERGVAFILIAISCVFSAARYNSYFYFVDFVLTIYLFMLVFLL